MGAWRGVAYIYMAPPPKLTIGLLLVKTRVLQGGSLFLYIYRMRALHERFPPFKAGQLGRA